MEQTPRKEPTIPRTRLRIFVLGPLMIEYADPQTGQFIPLALEKWHGKGAVPALSLMELLISRPHRSAPQDWIIEQFWPASEAKPARKRLGDVSSFLRSLLRSHVSDAETLLRHVGGTKERGSGYQLAPYPSIWVDADAFLRHMYLAALYTQMQDNPLPYLEAAYELGARGAYLMEDPYSDWAASRREEVAGAFRSCVHQLGHLYLKCGRLEEAELYVRSYWVTHMTDEDALRLLMNILGEQQRYQEAHDCYRQSCEMREQAGEPIDPRTHDLAEYWRTKPLRPPAKSFPQPSLVPPSQPSSLVAYENVIQFLQVIQAVLPRTVPNGNVSSEVPESDAALIIVLPTPGPELAIPSSDLGTWLSHKANGLRAIGTSGPPISDQERQADVDAEIENWNRMFDQNHPQRNEFLSTRRTVLADLVLVSASILAWVQSGKTTTLIAKEFLAQCATSITACYHLLKGDGFLPVEYALSQYLPYLIALAKSPSPVQKEAAYLAAQGCCLMSLIKLHRLQFHERVALCKQGVEFARVTGDSLLLVATLAELGIAWFESGQSKNMLQEYQEAERLLPKEPPLFPLRLQSRIYTGLSGAYARTGHPQEAKNYLDLANAISLSSDDDLFIPCLDYDLSFKILWESFIHVDLEKLLRGQNKVPSKEARFHLGDADAALEQELPESTPERVLIEIILQRASIAVKLGDLGNFEKYLKEGAQKARALRSDKRQEEARDVWREAMQRWPHEDQVIKLWEWVL